MSETKIFRGTLREYKKDACLSLTDKLFELLREQTTLLDTTKHYTLDELFDVYYESELYENEKIIIHGENLFICEEKVDATDDFISHAKSNLDGTIDYLVMYYNGGCSFSEAVEDALDKLQNK